MTIAVNHAEENTVWRKFALASAACLAPSGVLAAYTLTWKCRNYLPYKT